VLELLADAHRGAVPLLLLLLWCGVVALQLLWRQIKLDATLGHRIMGGWVGWWAAGLS
jgi:hypothetical protein